MNKVRKYMLLFAIALMIGFCAYFDYAFRHVNDELLHEKMLDRTLNINVICDEIDKMVEHNNNWDTFNYIGILADITSQIDSVHGSYGELFDSNLRSLSQRTVFFEGNPFILTDYPEVVEMVRTQESGITAVWFDKPGIMPHDLHLFFRWVPTSKKYDHRLLVMTGASKYALNTKLSSQVIYGAVGLIVISSLCVVFTIIMLSQLGYIYEAREGNNKWRGTISSSPSDKHSSPSSGHVSNG